MVKEMEGKPYMSDTNTLLKAGLWSSQKLKRVLLQNREHLLVQRQKEIAVGMVLLVLSRKH